MQSCVDLIGIVDCMGYFVTPEQEREFVWEIMFKIDDRFRRVATRCFSKWQYFWPDMGFRQILFLLPAYYLQHVPGSACS